MRVKLTGKYLLLDIGKYETKFIEVLVKEPLISVTGSGVFSQMSDYVSSEGVLKNIDKFSEALILTLERSGITAKNICICSSVLGIVTKTQDWSNKEYPNVREMEKHFEREFGRKSSNTKISGWQQYGKILLDSEIKNKIVLSTGNLALLKGLVEAFKSRWYSIISIEDSVTALSNLIQIQNISFDTPSTIFIDFGAKTRLQAFKSGALVQNEDLTSTIHNLAKPLAEELGIEETHSEYLLSYVGYLNDDKAESLFKKESITSEEYFLALDTVLKSEIKSFETELLTAISLRDLEDTNILLCGGILDKDGFWDKFKEYSTLRLCDRFELVSSILKSDFELKNKHEKIINSKYACCVGMSLKNNVDNTLNLYPQECSTIELFTYVDKGMKLLKWGSIVACSVLTLGIIINGVNYFRLRNVDSYLSEMQLQSSTLKSQDIRYKSYISSLTKVDAVVTPLISFLQKNSNPSLRIASVDTLDMLETKIEKDNAETEVEVPAIKVVDEEKGKEVKEDASYKQDTKETVEVYVKPSIIIRGYATDSAEITELFKRLDESEFAPTVAMNGVKQITLPSGEAMHIFEIEVGR